MSKPMIIKNKRRGVTAAILLILGIAKHPNPNNRQQTTTPSYYTKVYNNLGGVSVATISRIENFGNSSRRDNNLILHI